MHRNSHPPPDRPPPIAEFKHATGRYSFLFDGLRAALSAPGFVLLVTFIGYGGLLHDIGFPIGAGILSTVLIWALPAQVILVGGLAAGTSLPALALAVCLSGVRLMPMVVAIRPLLRNSRSGLLGEILIAHFVAVTMWVEGLRLLPKVPAVGRPAFAFGLGGGLVSISAAGTYAGFHLTGWLPGPLAVALLLLTPISFAILLVRNATTTTDWLAIAFGAILAPIAAQAPGGLDLFWSGVGGGTLAFLAGKLFRRRS